jgi:hypothetical protein
MAIEITDAKRLRQEVSFVLQPEQMLQLCGQLQLALRHPGNNGGAGSFARSFVDVCVQWFRDRGHVACVTVLERGDDPTFDMDSAFDAAKVRARVEVLQECVRLLTAPTEDQYSDVQFCGVEIDDRLETFHALARDYREARGDVLEAFDRLRHALQQLEALR